MISDKGGLRWTSQHVSAIVAAIGRLLGGWMHQEQAAQGRAAPEEGVRRRGGLAAPGGTSLQYAPDARTGVRTGRTRAIHPTPAASRQP